MKIVVCIGSSCHVKGSRLIIETFQRLIAEHNLKDKVDLAGTFCMGDCVHGVNVKLDGIKYSLSPQTAETFFNEHVLCQVRK